MIRKKLFENFAHPRGLWGRLAGQVMAHKPANVERGRWALAELDPGPDDRVVELGYGPGVTLSDACRRVSRGQVIGVDRSSVMLRQARRRNAGPIREGRLELRVGDAQQLDADLSGFDLIYGINVRQFWTDQAATILGLAGRLGPAGRLALVYMRPPRGSTTGDEAAERLQKQFVDAGLAAVEHRTMRFDPPAVMVIGHRG
jgi:ubiquinone/menaquinone biosynthesis C-methylase UbiE